MHGSSCKYLGMRASRAAYFERGGYSKSEGWSIHKNFPLFHDNHSLMKEPHGTSCRISRVELQNHWPRFHC
jgi:predicted N-acetyltransferase YhbS